MERSDEMELENSSEYKYKGMNLIPSIFMDLMLQLFDGKQFKRQDAIDAIYSYHLTNGGIVENNRDMIGTFKHATRLLRDKGYDLTNNGYGIWVLHNEIISTNQYEPEENEIVNTTYEADECLGDGLCAVYVYYYETYKQLSELKGEKKWACKIGRTDRNPIQRIINQSGTCCPEIPHIALVIYCDDSCALESTLHSILKLNKRWLADAPGVEWFITSPEEVKSIYNHLMNMD